MEIRIKVLPCRCTSTFQDRTYGKGQRLHNACVKGKLTGYRCTVCGDKKAD